MRLSEFYDPEYDKLNSRKKSDKRKRMFTLRQLNKLRKYRDIREIENKEHEDFVKVMYATPSGDDGGPGLKL